MSSNKKRILFINRYFEVGGIQSSMINMANVLCEDYDVDIFAYYPKGELKERLDSRVNVLKPSWPILAMGMLPKDALREKKLFHFLFRIFGSVWSKLFDNRLPIYIATKIQPKLMGYDLAIAYRAETRKSVITSGYARVLDRCVKSKVKATWIHYDANTLNNSSVFNEKYYRNIDKIIGVSKSVMDAFETVNPSLSEKMDYCYNFLNYSKIYENSKKEQEIKYPSGKFVCFSACRLSKEKGIVRGITALAPVLKEHNDVVWFIAGDGPERENIEAAVKSLGLENRIVLIGNQKNPYPYMKNADLYLSLSFHEAAPMVYLEAKALHVPVFTTKTLSSYEMLKDGIEDFVCENSGEGIREKFIEIMKDKKKVKNAKKNLECYNGNNNESFAKIIELCNFGEDATQL
ncbi:MAG: glycosyltransferase [Clostridia bacterium]|nr:glycosyltransferase [Clostridia bacterium]